MRRLMIAAAAGTLFLSACKNNDQHDNTMNVDENLTAENIVSNDVTAIDAVTGDAANMAADVNYTAELNDTADNNVDGNSAKPAAKPRPKPPTTKSAEPTTDAASNTAE